MAKLLYLVHRMPYPLYKGDEVHSYHLLKHLAEKHQVFVGRFISDPADAVHDEALCAQWADLERRVAQASRRYTWAPHMAMLDPQRPVTCVQERRVAA